MLGHPSPEPVELPEALGYDCVDRRKYGGSGLSFFEPKPAAKPIPEAEPDPLTETDAEDR